jgi:hypothetical protein
MELKEVICLLIEGKPLPEGWDTIQDNYEDAPSLDVGQSHTNEEGRTFVRLSERDEPFSCGFECCGTAQWAVVEVIKTSQP